MNRPPTWGARLSRAEIVAAVIGQADRGKPADLALREELRRQRGLSPATAAAISRMVFRYYRWFGWLEAEPDLAAQLRRAEMLEAQFRAQPGAIEAGELQSRAVPGWVGDHLDVTDSWLRALQTEPTLWVRARRGRVANLRNRLDMTPAGAGLSETFAFHGEEDLFRTPEFQAGDFEIQDIASQLVGHLCAPRSGETWWDACAGEGGKTLHLSDLMENQALIWASDRAAWRLQKLRRRAARAGVFNCRHAVWDGELPLPTKTRFDGVLVDAPCSGLGTWQRNPHARWTTTPADVQELALVQQRLLSHVAPSVKRGGRLIYSVCTMTRAETVGVVRVFGENHPDFAPLPLQLPVAIPRRGGDSGAAASLMIWPQDWGGNGMFVAAWRRLS